MSPQILNELYATLTNPKSVNSPLRYIEVLNEIKLYFSSIYIKKIFPTQQTVEILLDLLAKYHVTKQEIHDLNIVAIMLTYNISQICTYNVTDFKNYNEITVFSPEMILEQLIEQ